MDGLKKTLSADQSGFGDLEKRLHLDLTLRANGGTVIYLLVWLVSASWANIAEVDAIFFHLNTALLLIMIAMRIVHHRLVMTRPELNTKKIYLLLVCIILCGAFHWGMLSAWVMFSGHYQELYYPYMVMLPAFAIGGATVLSISRTISLFYPLLIYLPSIITILLFNGDREGMMLVALALLSLVYVFTTSRVAHNDYWSAIYNYKVAEERATMMKRLSTTDQLTKLHNRMYFEDKFTTEWDRCSRFCIPLAILMIDLDYFKSINDKYGHAGGDECLVQVAKVLRTELKRTSDTVARFGGEEFIAVISVTDPDALNIMAERLVHAVADIKMTHENQLVSISCSIGVASTIPKQGDDKEKLLIAADKALYLAKRNGRNQYCISDELFHTSDLKKENQELTNLSFV